MKLGLARMSENGKREAHERTGLLSGAGRGDSEFPRLTKRFLWLNGLGIGLLVIVVRLSIGPPTSQSPHPMTNRMFWDEQVHQFERKMYESNLAHDRLLSMGFPRPPERGLKDCLYFNNSQAFEMLRVSADGNLPESTAVDFFYYQQGWEAQINQAFCGVASAVAVMNSFRGYVELPQDPVYVPYPWATQYEILNNTCAQEKIGYQLDKNGHPRLFAGLGMSMVKDLLDCALGGQGFKVEYYPVDPTDISQSDLKFKIKEALKDDLARVIVNYDRGGFGQGNFGHGHFSPVGAYNEEMDAFLVMDVAKYKYPIAWVPSSKLFNGVATYDRCAAFRYPQQPIDLQRPFLEILKELNCQGSYRGFVVISRTLSR